MKNLFTLLLLQLFLSQGLTQTKIILDTDFGGDADDLGALAMLNEFKNKGECEVLGVMCWNVEKYAVSAIDAVNTFYGNPDIPIGARKDEQTIVDWNHSKVIADQFPHDATSENVPESTSLYRKILSESKDNEVTIITIGPLLNIKRLLESEGDDHSPLSGVDLVKKKVKYFMIMGGQFPEGKNEWNFNGDMPGVTKAVVSMIPVPIVFSGYEVGLDIKTGEVFNEIDKNTPLYVGFKHFSEHCPWLKEQYEGKIYDNSTYDQTAILYAVRGGVGKYWEEITGGYCLPDDTGGNTWVERGNKDHVYLKLLMSNEAMESVIEDFMLGIF